MIGKQDDEDQFGNGKILLAETTKIFIEVFFILFLSFPFYIFLLINLPHIWFHIHKEKMNYYTARNVHVHVQENVQNFLCVSDL